MTTTATTWTRERAGFYRSADGRFDVWRVTLDGLDPYWVAVVRGDGVGGGVVRTTSGGEAMNDDLVTTLREAADQIEEERATVRELVAALSELVSLIRDSDQERPPSSMRLVGIVTDKRTCAALDAARAALAKAGAA